MIDDRKKKKKPKEGREETGSWWSQIRNNFRENPAGRASTQPYRGLWNAREAWVCPALKPRSWPFLLQPVSSWLPATRENRSPWALPALWASSCTGPLKAVHMLELGDKPAEAAGTEHRSDCQGALWWAPVTSSTPTQTEPSLLCHSSEGIGAWEASTRVQ